MKIASIVTQGLERLGDKRLDCSASDGQPADIVVVHGARASGKTAVLEVVLAAREQGIVGSPEAPWRPRVAPGNAAAKVQIEWALSDAELRDYPGEQRRSLEAIFDAEPNFPPDNDASLCELLSDEREPSGRIEYFHAGRSLPRTLSAGPRRARCSTDNAKYSGLRAFLRALVVEEPAKKALLDDAFEALGVNVRLTRVSSDGEPLFSDGGRLRSTRELSSSEQALLLVLATALEQRLDSAPILLDVPDLFLDVNAGRQLCERLRVLAPRCQLLVATSSSELAAYIGRLPRAITLRLEAVA
ncbi:MAG TPA: hypothetical protein VFB62_18005 [Polyangiaceae bacterium]|jgi:hypothetical protein|nr:hypothetical protein [Polyangiaceae bacterium]